MAKNLFEELIKGELDVAGFTPTGVKMSTLHVGERFKLDPTSYEIYTKTETVTDQYTCNCLDRYGIPFYVNYNRLVYPEVTHHSETKVDQAGERST